MDRFLEYSLLSIWPFKTFILQQFWKEKKKTKHILKQPNRKMMWRRGNMELLKWWDVSALVMKNFSVFMFDCVTAGMPLLQRLASCPSYIQVWVALPLPAKSCKCSSFVASDSDKTTMTAPPVLHYHHLYLTHFTCSQVVLNGKLLCHSKAHLSTPCLIQRGLFSLFRQSQMPQVVPSPQPSRENHCDLLPWFSVQRFIAAKATEKTLNSKTPPDRCCGGKPCQLLWRSFTLREQAEMHCRKKMKTLVCVEYSMSY